MCFVRFGKKIYILWIMQTLLLKKYNCTCSVQSLNRKTLLHFNLLVLIECFLEKVLTHGSYAGRICSLFWNNWYDIIFISLVRFFVLPIACLLICFAVVMLDLFVYFPPYITTYDGYKTSWDISTILTWRIFGTEYGHFLFLRFVLFLLCALWIDFQWTNFELCHSEIGLIHSFVSLNTWNRIKRRPDIFTNARSHICNTCYPNVQAGISFIYEWYGKYWVDVISNLELIQVCSLLALLDAKHPLQ